MMLNFLTCANVPGLGLEDLKEIKPINNRTMIPLRRCQAALVYDLRSIENVQSHPDY